MNTYSKMEAFRCDAVFTHLPADDQAFIARKAEEFRLTVQEIRTLCTISADLSMWGADSLRTSWRDPDPHKYRGRNAGRHAVGTIRRKWEEIKSRGPDYSSFSDPSFVRSVHLRPLLFEERTTAGALLGRCPVASPRTRCCRLLTLDAVLGCGFGCTYCSIQTFAGRNAIIFRPDLQERLAEIPLDPEQRYHIGTGQSSDSLMFGNRGGLLDALCGFARQNTNVILELKTKAALVKPLIDADPPSNVVATWSLNPQVVITAEERLTAGLEKRLRAARRAADAGIPVGFHFHPIVPFQGWREAYGDLYRMVLNRFRQEEVVMVSFGTVTLIRPVMRSLRVHRPPSRILQLPFEDAAGKFSIPTELKLELFTHAYQAFRPWHASVFFYLCMEDPDLWKPVFGFEYDSNSEFETAMKDRYRRKMRAITRRPTTS